MDPNTVYRHLQLSDGGRKATMKAENLNPPDHPERFHFWRQVLCREPLGGSPYYWEVEWSGQKVCGTVSDSHTKSTTSCKASSELVRFPGRTTKSSLSVQLGGSGAPQQTRQKV